jgi:hypothetical protein
MSAGARRNEEPGADRHGEGAAYLIKVLAYTPRRGIWPVVSNSGRVSLSCARGIAEGATDLT